MNIKVTKSGSTFFADFTELPGSPYVGTGFTEAEAVATLFIRNMEKLPYMNTSVLSVNGELYMDPGPKR
jgi:hypothetical protein